MTLRRGTVAVVIAAYNAAESIDGALASVAAQTAPCDEVVVADDCSTDATSRRAAAWAKRLPLVTVRTAINGGPSVARRAAIEASRSDLIAVLDADDAWLPDHLATMLDCLGGDTLVTADPTNWLPGEALGGRWSDRHPLPATDQLRHLYQENFVFSGTLFERRLYERVGGFRPTLRVGEDWDLWIRMVRAGARVERPSRTTLLYRVGGESMTVDRAAGDDRVAVLEIARREAGSDDERRAIATGLRRVRAERDLFAAYRLTAEGRRWAARRRALGALAGRRRVAVRAAGLVLAPAAVTRRRQRARADPRARLNE